MRARPGLSRPAAAATLALAAVAAAVAGLPVERAAAMAVHRSHVADRPYQIYLLKGFADIFSSGLDFLQTKLRKRGITADVRSYSDWQKFADETIARWRGGAHGPIIIIGHSFGGDAAVRMSERLGDAGVPVALVVTFSPTETLPVNGNVAHAVNYWLSNSSFHGRITRGPGFHGTLETIDLAKSEGVGHFNIEKLDSLHTATIAKVMALVSHHARAPETKPDADKPDVDKPDADKAGDKPGADKPDGDKAASSSQ